LVKDSAWLEGDCLGEGRFTQMLPNNWKLYMENVKDSYHASILHLFFTTFEINRLSQKGAVIVDESGRNHVSYSAIDPEARDDTYSAQDISLPLVRSSNSLISFRSRRAVKKPASRSVVAR
jgi:phenylpropionate dioxygenase-like ring-hydroxylating dioxygenase large terminal subunit